MLDYASKSSIEIKGFRFMRARLLIAVIALLLLTSSGSDALALSLCLVTQQDHSCCAVTAQDAGSPGSASAHRGMDMDGMSMTDDYPAVETGSIGQSAAPCSHCASGARLPTSTAAIVGNEGRLQRSAEAAPPPTAAKAVVPQVSSFAPPAASRQHAPPWASTPRHIFINLFLI